MCMDQHSFHDFRDTQKCSLSLAPFPSQLWRIPPQTPLSRLHHHFEAGHRIHVETLGEERATQTIKALEEEENELDNSISG